MEDAAYIGDIQRLGYRPPCWPTCRVHHTGGPYYSTLPKEKDEYWRKYWARQRAARAVKKVLVRVPVRPPPERPLRLVRGALLSSIATYTAA